MKFRPDRKFLFMLIPLILCLLLGTALDRLLLGRILPSLLLPGLIFPPYTITEYQTPEFHFTASINNLGLRGPAATLAKHGRLRIAAFGDSFTYGWGVDFEDSWPRQLELVLQKENLEVEVLNLGQPGGGPIEYAKLAERALPLLQPDLVIIAVLQDDDLAQSLPPEPPPGLPAKPKKKKRWKKTLAREAGRFGYVLYPHLSGLILKVRAKTISASAITAEWQKEAKAFLSSLTEEDWKRYQRLDPEVKRLFEAGELNPALVILALRHPDYLALAWDLEHPDTQRRIQALTEQLQRVKRAAHGVNAKAILITIPLDAHLDHRGLENRTRLGFNVNENMLFSDAPDRAVAQAAQAVGLDFYTVTDRFRQVESPGELYYRLDGHFRPSGHWLFAHAIAPIVTPELESLPGR